MRFGGRLLLEEPLADDAEFNQVTAAVALVVEYLSLASCRPLLDSARRGRLLSRSLQTAPTET